METLEFMQAVMLEDQPTLDQEEMNGIIAEYNATDKEVCYNCREVVSTDDLEYELSWSGGYDSPDEYTSYCPHCGTKEPDLVEPNFKDFYFNIL